MTDITFISFGLLSLFLFFTCATLHYSRKSIIPFVTWILLGGIGYGFAQNRFDEILPTVHIEPNQVFFLLLPILIFASAKNIKFKKMESVGWQIGFFATVGVVLGSFLTAFLVNFFFGIPFADALLFGAIISATDPAAILSIFKRFKMPEKLKLLVEGESLLNDGTAVIFFALLTGYVIDHSPFVLGKDALQIFWTFGGSIGVGILMGFIAAKLLHIWHEEKNEVIEATITVTTALFTFLLTEHFLHASGVIAVMAAAMTFANSHYCVHILDSSKEAAHLVDRFWNLLDTLVNSILFFLLGVEIGLHVYDITRISIPFVILILLVTRAVIVYGGSIVFLKTAHKIPISWQHVMNLGGLKGALSIALLLLLPSDCPHRLMFLCIAFVMIVWTLLVNTSVLAYMLKKGFGVGK